jgi:hypothetical protein
MEEASCGDGACLTRTQKPPLARVVMVSNAHPTSIMMSPQFQDPVRTCDFATLKRGTLGPGVEGMVSVAEGMVSVCLSKNMLDVL